MSPLSKGLGPRPPATRSARRPRALLTAIFCAFAALLPIVCVVAPKGTVVLLLLAAVLAVPIYWWEHRRFPVPDLRFSIALALLVVWCAVASAWSPDVSRSLVLVLRIVVILFAGMVLFPVAAVLDDKEKKRVGHWLLAGFGLSLALMVAEIGLDYPVLRSFKEADGGNQAAWFNRGAVAMALIVWLLVAGLWARGLGWKAMIIPVLLGVASFFLESAAATLGFVAGIGTVLLALAHRRVGLVLTIVASVVVFVGMPFAARLMYSHGWHRADWLVGSAQHRVEIWNFSVQRIAEEPLLGWGFDASRHLGGLYPDTSGTGRELMALHPHSAPLQITLELGAVGAVIALALLVLAAVRLDAMPNGGHMFGHALLVSAVAIGCVSFGLWQNWWLALIVSVALLVPLTAAQTAREGGTVRR